MSIKDVDILLETLKLGENENQEFKDTLTPKISKDIVAFANTQGGSIFLGVNDKNKIVGFELTNKKRSEVDDITKNIDPPVLVEVISHPDKVTELKIPESPARPHRSSQGFFVRRGASSIKLTRNEIAHLIIESGEIAFDSARNFKFRFEEHFDNLKFREFLVKSNIEQSQEILDYLLSLNLVQVESKEHFFTNAAVLFFAKNPQLFFPEAVITFTKYSGKARGQVASRVDFSGSLIEQIDKTLLILEQNNLPSYFITEKAQRKELFSYPGVVLREALINAVMHREYLNFNSRIYINLFDDRIEFENPGGLIRDISISNFGKRSSRRNPLIAKILEKAKYVESLGSGIPRIRNALKENGNPALEFSSDNFFTLTFYEAVRSAENARSQILTERLQEVLLLLKKNTSSSTEIARELGYSKDTILLELDELMKMGLVDKIGKGRATRYLII